MGAHYRSSSTENEQDFEVERIINHENYKRPRGLAHDIAMLKLRKPAKISETVGLACLPAYSQDVTEIDDKDCWVTGITRTLLKTSASLACLEKQYLLAKGFSLPTLSTVGYSSGYLPFTLYSTICF